jgi:hypothetical protein
MARKKTKVKVAPRRKGGKLAGPSFEGWENMDPQAFGKLQRASVDFYYRDVSDKDVAPTVYTWMAENGYDKKQIANAKKARIPLTVSIYCRVLLDGCPDYNPAYAEYWESLPGTGGKMRPLTEFIHPKIKEAIAQGEKIVEEAKVEETKPTGPVKTIQQRMQETAAGMCAEIDEVLDQLMDDPKNYSVPKDFKIINKLRAAEAKAAHARVIKGFYEGQLKEYDDLLNFPTAAQLKKMTELDQDLWAQLKEGYTHRDKKDIKKLHTFISEIVNACDMIAQEQKVNRKPRKAKAINKEKLVAKVKYKKTDEALALVSVNPADIIGANELWIYNTKSRKIGKYVAKNVDPTGMGRDGSGLTIKGTTIQGYDEEQSVMKTIRKPDEKLAEFKSAGKVALRKFLDEINAVEARMNGRINADTILLKVVS